MLEGSVARNIINATEAARAFSQIINSVEYKGESYTVLKGGKPVAAIVPVRAAIPGRTLKELKEIINDLPRLGKDTESFFKDVADLIRCQPHLDRKRRQGNNI
ncbi:MAG: type II toxin-antitoxin system prevent-host-death family antitoxin [Nitrospirota bacterium]